MTDLTTLDSLYRHMDWADAALWRTALDTDGAPGDDRLCFLLHHIHTVQHAFHCVWTGRTLDLPTQDSFTDLDALCRWGRTRNAALRVHLGTLDTEDLTSVPDVPWTAQVAERLGVPPTPAELGATLLQVALHSLHHRAQASSQLRALGAEPSLTDYIAWVWLDRPDADWPVSL